MNDGAVMTNIVPTYTATLYVGLLERDTRLLHTQAEALAVCQEYVDDVGLCVTFTPTTFVYTNGSEPGVIVGLINYPRFPVEPEDIREKALVLAESLRAALGQWRLSVVFPDETVMLCEST